jgi:hypothetical protein
VDLSFWAAIIQSITAGIKWAKVPPFGELKFYQTGTVLSASFDRMKVFPLEIYAIGFFFIVKILRREMHFQ